MDWKMIMLACAIALAGILSWKLWKLKQDVREFADRLDESLDAVLQGRKPGSPQIRRILFWEKSMKSWAGRCMSLRQKMKKICGESNR